MGSAIFKTLTTIISSIYWYWLQKVFLFRISTSFLMALKLHSHESQAFPTIKNPENPSQQPTLPASDSVSPILAISLFCIIASVFLLASYFIFLTKWFHNLNQLNLLRRFSIMQTRYSNDSIVTLTPTALRCGLEESTIRDIPIQRFSREFEEKSMNGCVVCLSEFQEQDMLRVLPICSHGFHLDCIDIWLQTNSNCPLCRTSISGKTRAPAEAIMAPISSPLNPLLLSDNLMDDDEDFVVIELRGEDEMERNDFPGETKRKRCRHVSIMGDEAIDVRGKDELFSVQPIRRSFSMDSAAGHELYSAVERTITVEKSEESSSRCQRSFFAVRQGRGSRNAVLPLEF